MNRGGYIVCGALIWMSTPGTAPTDSSYSTPVVAQQDGRKVLYVGTGCGNVVCMDARTGRSTALSGLFSEMLWGLHSGGDLRYS